MGSMTQTRILRNSLVLMLLSAVAGCSTAGGGDRHPSSQLRLVKLTPAESSILLTAAATGTIAPRGRCVYFVGARDQRTLALWPAYFELDTLRGAPVGVRNTLTGTRVAFGEPHTFGGGNMEALPGMVLEPVPAGCSGPAMMLYFD